MPSPLSPDELIPDYIDGRLRISGSFTRREIAEAFGISHDTAQRAIAAFIRRWPQALRRTKHNYVPRSLPYAPVRDVERGNVVVALAERAGSLQRSVWELEEQVNDLESERNVRGCNNS